MKNVILAAVTGCFFFSTAFGQLGSEVKKTIARGKAYDKAKTITNTNHNYIATQYLKDEKFRYNCPKANSYCKLSSSIVKTGRKDPNGNDIIYVNMKSEDGKESYILKPDFEDFPMTYICFSVAPKQVIREDRLSRPGKNRLNKTNMFLVANDGATFSAAQTTGTNADDEYFVKSIKDGEADFLLLKNYMDKLERNVRYDNADHEAFLKKNYNRLYSEAQSMWKAALAFNDKALANAKAKKYEGLMNEMQSGQYFLLSSSGYSYDSLKIDFKKDGSGKLTEIKMQFPYLDNVYYDKEKFFLSVTKGTNGLFELAQKTEFIDLLGSYSKKKLIIPFEGRLIVLSGSGSSPYIVEYIITNDLTDQLAHNIIGSGLYFQKKLWASDVQTFNLPNHPSDTEKTVYGEWWIKSNLESSYKYDQDMIYFDNFLNSKYIQTLLAK